MKSPVKFTIIFIYSCTDTAYIRENCRSITLTRWVTPGDQMPLIGPRLLSRRSLWLKLSLSLWFRHGQFSLTSLYRSFIQYRLSHYQERGQNNVASAAVFSFPSMFSVAGCKLHCESSFVLRVVYFVFCLFRCICRWFSIADLILLFCVFSNSALWAANMSE